MAENSGGVHCLKYGVTSNHVLKLEVVLPDGTVTQLGNGCAESPELDLRGHSSAVKERWGLRRRSRCACYGRRSA